MAGVVVAASIDSDSSDYGRGLALPGLIVGLLTGLAVYGIVEYWIDDGDEAPLPITVLFFVITAAVSYLLLAETNKLFRAAGGALVIAALLILPDYFLASKADSASTNLTAFPGHFLVHA